MAPSLRKLIGNLMLTFGLTRCLLNVLQYARRDFSSLVEKTRSSNRVEVSSSLKKSSSPEL